MPKSKLERVAALTHDLCSDSMLPTLKSTTTHTKDTTDYLFRFGYAEQPYSLGRKAGNELNGVSLVLGEAHFEIVASDFYFPNCCTQTHLSTHAVIMSFFATFKKMVGINNVYDNHTTKDHFHVGLVRRNFSNSTSWPIY